jgi:hypothetical protein
MLFQAVNFPVYYREIDSQTIAYSGLEFLTASGDKYLKSKDGSDMKTRRSLLSLVVGLGVVLVLLVSPVLVQASISDPLPCAGSVEQCSKQVAFNPNSITAYIDYPVNGETVENQFRSRGGVSHGIHVGW